MAVKETLENIQPFLQEDVHIVSIAAGVELGRLHDWTSDSDEIHSDPHI
jgi:pyrroline-5-carboxylate reductase